MESARILLAQRLREARERLGLTQRELAEAAGFSAHQIVSQIEKGEREVKAWELAELARVLSVSMQGLLSSKPIARPVVLWRDFPSEGAGVKEAKFLERYRRFFFVQQPITPCNRLRSTSSSNNRVI